MMTMDNREGNASPGADRDKQIEEMALTLSEGGCGKKCDCNQGDKFNCFLLHSASVLYNAGYRKASEVAREIGDEIAKNLMQVKALPNYVAIEVHTLISIINKYTEGEG